VPARARERGAPPIVRRRGGVRGAVGVVHLVVMRVAVICAAAVLLRFAVAARGVGAAREERTRPRRRQRGGAAGEEAAAGARQRQSSCQGVCCCTALASCRRLPLLRASGRATASAPPAHAKRPSAAAACRRRRRGRAPSEGRQWRLQQRLPLRRHAVLGRRLRAHSSSGGTAAAWRVSCVWRARGGAEAWTSSGAADAAWQRSLHGSRAQTDTQTSSERTRERSGAPTPHLQRLCVPPPAARPARRGRARRAAAPPPRGVPRQRLRHRPRARGGTRTRP
jgi:hypothetical protein